MIFVKISNLATIYPKCHIWYCENSCMPPIKVCFIELYKKQSWMITLRLQLYNQYLHSKINIIRYYMNMEANSMSRKAATLHIMKVPIKILIIVAGRRTEEARMVLRAKFILGSLKYSNISWHFSYDKYNPWLFFLLNLQFSLLRENH